MKQITKLLMALAKSVFLALDLATPVTAKDLARKLPIEKKQINSILYTLQTLKLVNRLDVNTAPGWTRIATESLLPAAILAQLRQPITVKKLALTLAQPSAQLNSLLYAASRLQWVEMDGMPPEWRLAQPVDFYELPAAS